MRLRMDDAKKNVCAKPTESKVDRCVTYWTNWRTQITEPFAPKQMPPYSSEQAK